MARYSTRNQLDRARFIASLKARGYTLRPGPPKGGSLPINTYQLSQYKGTYSVGYYEPIDLRPKTRTPEPVDLGKWGKGKRCTHPGCKRPHRGRGLCAAHLWRWNYQTRPEFRERHLKRLAATKAERRKAA
jgi:hypothetical protein